MKLACLFVLSLLAPMAQSPSVSFRIDRVISGIRIVGTPPDVSVEDVKTSFEIPRDKEAVVYFEWSGPSGTHRFEGIWRNPSGQEAGRSPFVADSASGKFAGSWKLFLNENTLPGRWTIESWVDGQIVGRYGIDVRVGDAGAPGAAKSPTRLPSLAEILRKANAATVLVEHIDKNGAAAISGSGFFVSPNTIVTTFSVIDGASSLRLRSGERTFTTSGVVAWNRFQDWAVIRTGDTSADFLPLADSKEGQVGERCLALSSGAGTERVLIDGLVGGILSRPKIGDRLTLSISPLSTEYDAVKDQSTGSPLMNMAGEVVAIAAGPGSVLPGSGSVGVVRSHNLFESDSPFEGLKVLGIPTKYFATVLARTNLTFLAQLTSNLEFVSDLSNARYIQSGTIALHSDANGNPVGEAFTFRPSAKHLQVFISWNVAERFTGPAALKVFDESNRLVFDSKPQTVSTPSASKWVVYAGDIPLDPLPPGTYRVDYVLNGIPAWRSFFRIIP